MCELHESIEPSRGGLDRRMLLRTVGAVALGVGVAGAAASPALAVKNSQNGWPGITAASNAALNRGFSAAGVTFPGGVRTGDVGTVLAYVARQFDAKVERLRSGWCWGWAYRDIVGSSTLSNHASATAIDVNAPNHPLGKSGTFSSAQRAQIQAILAVCEGTVRWGGNYSGRKDEMHFEINVPPGNAALARVAKKLGGNPDPGTPTPTSGWPTLKKGSTGYQVIALQYLLRARGHSLAADGSYGDKTVAAVSAFQSKVGLARDGVAGPKTWAKVVLPTKLGSNGDAVRAVQRTLNQHGAKLAIDGAFGAGTKAAAVAFQKAKKLTADGIVGPATWAALV